MDFWTLLSKRTNLSRSFVKGEAMRMAYRGGQDPWMTLIISDEMTRIRLERMGIDTFTDQRTARG